MRGGLTICPVSPLTPVEVSRKAGVDRGYIDRLVQVGILAPSEPDGFSSGDVLRVRWVRSWEEAGVPLDAMAAAVREGRLSFAFLDVPAFDRFTALSTKSFREVSEAARVPMDLLKVVREAFGYAEPRPDDLVREDELAEAALIAIYRGQQEHVWSQSLAESIEGALEKAGLAKRMHGPPAVSFLDITGYTRLTEEHGDTAAVDLATRLSDLVRRSANENSGRPVKWLPPAHVGIHAGPVVFEGGDYFGRTVNLAARIGEYARPGEVVVSQQVVDESEGKPASFTEIGPVELKGVSEPLRLYVARRAGTASQP